MKYFILTGIIFSFILAGCSDSADPNYDEDYNYIKTLNIKEAVALANEWKYSNKDITSII